MEAKDPLEQAEDVLTDMQQQLAAEQTKVHAEMIVLATITERPVIQANLLHTASAQGIDYMTGLMIAIGLTSRNWGRVLASEANLDFTKYINPEAEAFCEGDDAFAHYLVKEILLIEEGAQAEKLRQEMKQFFLDHDAHAWGRAIVHTVGLYGELINAVLDVRNGDYEPGEDDDR